MPSTRHPPADPGPVDLVEQPDGTWTAPPPWNLWRSTQGFGRRSLNSSRGHLILWTTVAALLFLTWLIGIRDTIAVASMTAFAYRIVLWRRTVHRTRAEAAALREAAIDALTFVQQRVGVRAGDDRPLPHVLRAWRIERWEFPDAVAETGDPDVDATAARPRIRDAALYRLPDAFPVEDDNRRAGLLDAFVYANPHADWELDDTTYRAAGAIAFRELQPLPRFARFRPHRLSNGDLGPYHLVPVGVTAAGGTALIDLRTAPHILVTGSTGGGKSTFANTVFCHWLLHGGRITAVDPKLIGYTWLFGRPGVTTVALTPTAAQTVIAELRDRMLERYVARFNGDPWDDTPWLFAVDEYPDLVEELKDVYAGLDRDLKKRFPNTQHHMASLGRMARAVRIHLMLTLVRPDARFLEGPSRAQYRNRILTAPVESAVESTMLFGPGNGRVGMVRDLATAGRILVDTPTGGRVRAQGFWVANPDDPADWIDSDQLRTLDAPADDPVLTGQMTDGEATERWLPARPAEYQRPRLDVNELIRDRGADDPDPPVANPSVDVPDVDAVGDWADQIDAALDHYDRPGGES